MAAEALILCSSEGRVLCSEERPFAMAQIRSLMELADLGFVIAFRFYGRYPETGRTFYHPPPCESDRAPTEVTSTGTPPAGRRLSPARRPGLAVATSLMLPSFSVTSLSVLFSSGTREDLGQLPFTCSVLWIQHCFAIFFRNQRPEPKNVQSKTIPIEQFVAMSSFTPGLRLCSARTYE